MENNEEDVYEINNKMADELLEDEEDEEEYIEEDIYLIELHRRLGQMKKERKKAEQDTKLLDNRLNLLKTEEEKTWKKIAQTKKKTNEKIINLQNMAEIMRQKHSIKEERERELEFKKYSNQKMKSEINSNIQSKRDEKMRQISEEMKLLKLQKQYNKELTQYMRMEDINTNKNRYETIKGQQLLSEEKKKANDMERKLKLRMELEKQLMDEIKLKEEAENKVCQIENEEIEILKRIKTTTQVHKACNINIIYYNLYLVCDEFENMTIDAIAKKNYPGSYKKVTK